MHIHENDIVDAPPEGVDRVAAIDGGIGLASKLGQHERDHFQIHRIVFHHENAQTGNVGAARQLLPILNHRPCLLCVKRQHAADGLKKLGVVNRLAEEFPRCLAFDVDQLLQVFINRGQAYHRQLRETPRQFAQKALALKIAQITIQHRKSRRARLVQNLRGFGEIPRLLRTHSPSLQNAGQRAAQGLVAIDDEHRHFLQPPVRFQRIVRIALDFLGGLGRQGEIKGRPLVRRALEPDFATHDFDEIFANGQAQPRPAKAAGCR